MKDDEKRKLDEFQTVFKKMQTIFDEGLLNEGIDSEIDSLGEHLSKSIKKIGNQRDKTFLESMLNSNSFNIDKIQELINYKLSDTRFEQKVENLQGLRDALKDGLPRALKNREKLIKLAEKNSSIEISKSISVTNKEIAKMRHDLSSCENELERLKLSFNRKKILNLERQLVHQSKIQMVVLTEDEDTTKIEAILISNGFNTDALKIVPYKGINNSLFLNSLDLIRHLTPWAKILVHRDRDYLGDKEQEKLKEQAQKMKYYLFITHGYDIESYFLRRKHILELFPHINHNTIDSLIASSINKAKIASLKKMENVLHSSTESLFNSNPKKYVVGKYAVYNLSKELSNEIGSEVSLFKPSTGLEAEELKALFKSMSSV